MKTYNLGIIGHGNILTAYTNYLSLFSDDIVLYGGACRSLKKAKEQTKAHGILHAYASPEELLNDPKVDVVLNLTTPDVHFKYNKMALCAGKHVYTEKPLAATFLEGQELIRLAAEKNLKIGCAPDTFLGPRLQTMRRMIDSEQMGEIISASAFFLNRGSEWFKASSDFLYQPGGGPMLDMGPYYITALVALLGPVTSVSAVGKRTFPIRKFSSPKTNLHEINVHPDVLTHIHGLLSFAKGAFAQVTMSFDVWDSKLPRMEIYGTNGTICLLDDEEPYAGPNLFDGEILYKNEELYRWKRTSKEDVTLPWKSVQKNITYKTSQHLINKRGIGLLDMMRSIEENRPHLANGEMALHVLEIMSALDMAAKKQEVILLQTDCNRPLPLEMDDVSVKEKFF